jgi:SH3-like domain-containing protein
VITIFLNGKEGNMKDYKKLLIILVIFLTAGTAFAERLAVSVPKANIRSGPGNQYEVIWNCEKYYPVQVLKKNGDWYRFKDFEGDEGWVHNSIVDNTRTVITKNEKCNIRSGPGTQFDIVFTVERGVPFKVIEKKGQWLQIQHADGDKGWVFETLVW